MGDKYAYPVPGLVHCGHARHVRSCRDTSRRPSHPHPQGTRGEITQAGIVMSRRQIMRHCKAGTFDAQKLPAVNNVEEWFIAPASVEKGIADIKTLQSLRARRDATRRDMSESDEAETAPNDDTDTSGHDATRHDMTASGNRDDRERQTRSRHDMSRRTSTSMTTPT